MTTNTTVAIAPEAALRAVSHEHEYRRNRILVLENEVLRLEREVAEIKAAAAKSEDGKAKKDAKIGGVQ